MTYKLNPFTGKLDTSDGPQGPAGVVSAAGPGSEGTPSISFAADLDTGLYNYTANGIAVSTGGTGRLFVNASGNVGVGVSSPESPIHLPDGNVLLLGTTAATGTQIQHTGSANFLINNKEAGSQIFYTNDTERLRITSDGRAGLGTSSPSASALLDVADRIAVAEGSAATPSLHSRTDTDTGVNLVGTDRLSLVTAGSNRLFIDASGSVGIGTTSPGTFNSVANQLVVGSGSSNAGITLSTGTSSSGYLAFCDTGNTVNQGWYGYSHTDNALLLGANGSERARIDSSGTFRVKGGGTAGVTDAVQLNGSAPSNSLIIDGNGRVGLGSNTFSTLAKAEIVTASGVERLFINGTNNSSNSYIYIDAPANRRKAVVFRSGGSDRACIGVGDSDEANATSLFLSANANVGGASPHMVIDSSGNVGIGTASPQALFHTKSTATQSNIGYFESAGGTLVIRTQSAGGGETVLNTFQGTSSSTPVPFVIQQAGNESLRITSDGKLGLGTSSPDFSSFGANSGGIHIKEVGSNNSGVKLEQGTNRLHLMSSSNKNFIFGSTAHPLGISTNGTERLSITSDGNVGIGTTSPGGRLEIGDDSQNDVTVGDLLVDTTGLSADVIVGRLSSRSNDNTTFRIRDRVDNTLFESSTSAPAVFGRNGSELARIDSDGRLLVGTSSTPVSSTVVLEGRSGATTSEAILRLCRGQDTPADGATLGDLSFGDSNNGDAARIFAQRDGGTWTSASSRPSRLVFSTTADGGSSPTERMRITSGGQISIGAGNPRLPLHLQSARGGLTGNSNQFVIAANNYYDAANARLQPITDGWQSDIDFNHSSGHVRFRTSTSSVTVGNAATLAEAMRINSEQELLIGYTTDNGAYKLQVNSQIFATSATIATSDGRYKENVATLGGCLDLVKALRPVSFTWKPQADITRIDDDGNEVLVREGHNFPEGTQVGFIAQEVQTVLADKPWLGSVIKENVRPAVKDEEGNELAPEEQFFGIAEGNLIAVLTNALQEALAKIETLEQRLNDAGIA